MVYVERDYGVNKREAKRLLRHRLVIKNRIWQHKKSGNAKKLAFYNEKLKEVDKQIDEIAPIMKKRPGKRKHLNKRYKK